MVDYSKDKKHPISKLKNDFLNAKKVHFYSEKQSMLSEKLESDTELQTYSKFIKTFKPDVKAKHPGTFVQYASAEQVYRAAFYNIINYYPFDGTREEVLNWHLDSFVLDSALLRQFWPSSVGHIKLSASEYINFYAGPESISEMEFTGKLTQGESSLRLDPAKGNTVEFWLKKDSFEDPVEEETIFHVSSYPGKVDATRSGEFKVTISSSGGMPFKVTYKTGAIGAVNLQLNTDFMTPADVADSLWHHYAIQVTQVNNELKFKLYVDGQLHSTTIHNPGATMDPVDTYMAGTIGCAVAGTTGNLSGYLDEFRFWKGARTPEQISKFYDKKIYASNSLSPDYDSRLGVKFSFNKGIEGDNAKDSIVIDTSGNDVTGRIKNYNSTCRKNTSAIDESNSLNKEQKDPILDESNVQLVELFEELKNIGKSFDKNNNISLKNYLPEWTRDYQKGMSNDAELETLLQTLATEFDTIKMSIDAVRRLSTPEYVESFHLSNPDTEEPSVRVYSECGTEDVFFGCAESGIDYEIVSGNEVDFPERAFENLGLNRSNFPLLFLATPEEEVESIVSGISLEKSIYETRNLIYKCLYNTYSYLSNRKGTQSSYNSILNTIAAGGDVISTNIYGTDMELFISDEKVNNKTVELRSVSFADNNEECLFLHSSEAIERSYLEATNDETEYTFEGTFLFPIRRDLTYSVTDSSIFGVHEVTPTNNDLTVQNPDRASIQVSVEKENNTGNNARFVLSSNSGIFSEIKTDIIRNVYGQGPWNISVRVYKQSDNKFIGQDTEATYKIKLSGRNYISTELVSSFDIETELTSNQFNSFGSANKTIFIGAHRENLTGDVLKESDIKVVDFNAWRVSLTDSQISSRAKNLEIDNFLGVKEFKNKLGETQRDKNIILRMSPRAVPAVDSNNIIDIEDSTPSSQTMRDFYGSLVGSKYNFRSTEFSSNLDNVIQAEFLNVLQNIPVQNVYGQDGVQIKDNDFNKFDIDSKPNLKILSFEKSMYASISAEMIKFLGGVAFYNDVFSYVTKYRKSYKSLDQLRRMFFEGVENESQFERYVQYYRWIDKAVGQFLIQLVPASLLSNTGIENVVESHALERNKYDHKLYKINTKDLDLSTNLLAINELLYDWEHGHAPISQTIGEAENCLWQRDRKVKDSDREPLRKVLTTVVTGSNHASHFTSYVQRNLVKPYVFSSERQLDLEIGSNRKANKIDAFYRIINEGKEITLNKDDIYIFRECDDELEPSRNRKYTAKIDTTGTSGYLDGDADLLLPFSLFSSSVGIDFDNFKDDLKITNNHDSYAALQSSWISEHVGGMPHRRVKFGSYEADSSGFQKDRPEGYSITTTEETMTIGSPEGQKSIFNRGSAGSRFYNVANIKTKKTDSKVLVQGNYERDYEIVQTSARSINNSHLVRESGEGLTGSNTPSEYVRGITNYKVPTRQRREHIFVNQFSPLGGPEQSEWSGRDRVSGEFSVFNTVNYRNPIVREVYNVLSKERSERHGFRSGSSTVGSMHKTNRNFLRYTGSLGNERTADNYYLTHHMPQSDFGYSWITASADEDVYSFLNKNANHGHQHTFNLSGSLSSAETIQFLESSEETQNLDFARMNAFVIRSLDPDSNLESYQNASLNSVILNRQGPYGWPTWKQIRGEQHPVAKYHRKNNNMSLSYRGSSYNVSHRQESESTPVPGLYDTPRKTKSFKEIMVSNRFRPSNYSIHMVTRNDFDLAGALNELELLDNKDSQLRFLASWEYDNFFDSVGINSDGTRVRRSELPTFSQRYTITNQLSKFANQSLRYEANFKERLFKEDSSLAKMNIMIDHVEGPNGAGFSNILRELNYVEKIYPREINTFTSQVRSREKFDFFGWNSNRTSRSITLDGNLEYDNYIVDTYHGRIFPEITATNPEKEFVKSFFDKIETVDLNETSSVANEAAFKHVKTSKWVLDSREDFSLLPLNLTASYFASGPSFMPTRDQATRGEGILQNDYSIFNLGNNLLHATPPYSPVYNRRVPQAFGSNEYLAGEARWDAAKDHPIGPFYNNYTDFAEELRIVGQQYSIIPEFTISRFTEDLVNKLSIETDVDSQREVLSKMEDFLQVTGAVYNQSSGDFEIGSQFFKTYSTSDFLKYFSDFKNNVIENDFDLKPFRITFRCKAAKRFLPYRGFYPAERAVQIAELFSRCYNNTNTYTFERNRGATELLPELEKSIKKKLESSHAQSAKLLFAPGVLFNSIKSGLAVDYPVFNSSVGTFEDDMMRFDINNNGESIRNYDHLQTSVGSAIIGSPLNLTEDAGIPRISGTVDYRVGFDNMMTPSDLFELKVYDNEPHPSASLFYGSGKHFRYMDRPAIFGSLDNQSLDKFNGANFTREGMSFVYAMQPYREAIHNFTANTVDFFLKDQKLQTIMSEPVTPEMENGVTYRMRVFLRNNNIKMYDRHSAFGPPVDDGDPIFTRYVNEDSDIPGAKATAQIAFLNANSTNLLNNTLVLENTAGLSKTYIFSNGTVSAEAAEATVDFSNQNNSTLRNDTITLVDHENTSKTYVFKRDTSGTSAVAATASIDLSSVSAPLDLDGETFTLEDAGGDEKTYRFIKDDPGSNVSPVAATASISFEDADDIDTSGNLKSNEDLEDSSITLRDTASNNTVYYFHTDQPQSTSVADFYLPGGSTTPTGTHPNVEGALGNAPSRAPLDYQVIEFLAISQINGTSTTSIKIQFQPVNDTGPSLQSWPTNNGAYIVYLKTSSGVRKTSWHIKQQLEDILEELSELKVSHAGPGDDFFTVSQGFVGSGGDTTVSISGGSSTDTMNWFSDDNYSTDYIDADSATYSPSTDGYWSDFHNGIDSLGNGDAIPTNHPYSSSGDVFVALSANTLAANAGNVGDHVASKFAAAVNADSVTTAFSATIDSTHSHKVNLEQATAGASGNHATYPQLDSRMTSALTGFASDSSPDVVVFQGGVAGSSGAGAVTYTAGEILSSHSNQIAIPITSRTIDEIGAQLETAVEHSNGHAGDISVSWSTGTDIASLTQATAGTVGNNTIAYSNGLSGMISGFTGGSNGTSGINYNTGDLLNGNVIVNYTSSNTKSYIAGQLVQAIASSNGHGTTIVQKGAFGDDGTDILTLEQSVTGTDGNKTNSSNLSNFVSNFTGGQEAGTLDAGDLDSSGRVVVPVGDSPTLGTIVNRFTTALASSNGHAGTIIHLVRAFSRYMIVFLQQSEEGTAGNNIITGTGTYFASTPDAGIPLITGFVRGQDAVTGGTGTVLKEVSEVVSGSHGYLPYVPPFLDAGTSPYAEITYTHTSETGPVSIARIVAESNITYNNGITHSNDQESTNIKESMDLSATLSLRSVAILAEDNVNFVRQSEPDAIGNILQDLHNPSLDRPRWVIQAKWETPVLDFKDAPAAALNLGSDQVEYVTGSPWQTRYQTDYYQLRESSSAEYLTASTGMWHQRGEVPASSDGYTLEVRGPEKTSATLRDLAGILGFTQNSSYVRDTNLNAPNIAFKKLGELADDREVCEAVVIIPFYQVSQNTDIQLIKLNENDFENAKNMNEFTNVRHIQLLTMHSDPATRKDLIKRHKKFIDNPKSPDGKYNIAYQLRMMEKFILPPQFDFINFPGNVDKHVQYFFQFKGKIKKEELAQIWQNLYPDSNKGIFRAQHSSVFHTREQVEENIETTYMYIYIKKK